MKLFKIETKKGITDVGGKDKVDTEEAFTHIYPHLEIIKTEEACCL